MTNFNPPPPPGNQSLPPLEQLRDIHLPEAVKPSPFDADSVGHFFIELFSTALSQPSAVPLAGWFILISLILLPVAVTYVLWRRFRRNAYRRTARKELKQLLQVCDDAEFCNASARLLKRVVIHHIDTSAATRHGQAWQSQLQRLYPRFAPSAVESIAQGQYQAQAAMAKQQLYTAVDDWLRRHRA